MSPDKKDIEEIQDNPINQLTEQLYQKYGEQAVHIALSELLGYEEIPPSIEQFVDGSDWLGSVLEDGLYVPWRKALYEIYPNPFYSPFSEICLSGSIGSGKTSVGLIGCLYDLTRIMMLKEPQKKFGLLSTTTIAYAIINLTLTSAKNVLYNRLRDMIASSPILRSKNLEALRQRGKSKTVFPKGIDIILGSRMGHALGADIIGAILDEMNFQDKVKDQAYKNYTTIERRIESRFLQPGNVYPARVWMISSKNKSSDFLEQHIKKKINSSNVKIYDYPIWEIQKYKIKYCGKTFKVFCGDATKDPRIVKNKNDIIGIDEARIIDVPIEYYNKFKDDIHNSLRDLAGKSTDSVFKYIPSVEVINKALQLNNPVFKEEIVLDLNSKGENIIDFIDTKNLITPQYPYNHRHIHIDMALGKKDRLSIVSSFIANVSTNYKTDNRTGLEIPTREPFYITEFAIAIKARSGSEIPLYKIKEFLSLLKNSLGYPLVKVTQDGFQSAQLRQDLNMMGIESEYLSVDKTKEPYEILKQALISGKWLCVKSDILKKELTGLVDTGKKIDHLSDGSKDISDGCAGSIASAYYTYCKFPQIVSEISSTFSY